MATEPDGPHETPIARGTLPSGRPYTLMLQINLQTPRVSEEPLTVEDRAYLLDVVWPAAREQAIAALQTLPRFRSGWGTES